MIKTGIRVGAAVWLMVSVSLLIGVYGLGDIIFFNKAAVSLGVFLFGLWYLPKAYGQRQKGKRIFAIAYVLALVLTFTEIAGAGMRLEVARGGVDLSAGGVLIMAGAALIMALAAEPCLNRILRFSIEQSGKPYEKRKLNQAFLAAWGILFLGYLPCLLAFYPGLYCYDMIWQWQQFVQWDLNTHHPLIHTLLAGSLFELGNTLGGSWNKGIFLYCLVQIALLTGSMAFALRFLVKQRSHPAAVICTGLFFLLFPFFPVMGISTTKDTIFAGLFLIVFVCICDMAAKRTCYTGPKLAGFLICSVLMCLFRNNAVYGLGLMALVMAAAWTAAKLRHKNSRFLVKAIGLVLVCMAVSQGMFAVMEKGLDAKKGSKAEMLSLPMQQMARCYFYHQDEFSPADKEQLLTYFDEESLLRYKYYVSDPVKAGIRMENFRLSDFAKLWMKLGRQFPGEYVKSPAYNLMGLWYLGGDSSCYVEYQMSPPIDEDHPVETRSKIKRLKDFYSWFTDENLQRYLPGLSLFFYTSFYSWCVVIGAGVLLAKRNYPYLILPLFLAAYGCTLVFGPCMNVRYMMCIMVCIPVLAVMVFKK